MKLMVSSNHLLMPYLLALLLTGLICGSVSHTIDIIEARIGDSIWRWIGKDTETEQRLLIVDIDEASIERYGAWPWSREQIAKLSGKINQLGATLQVFDMVFSTAKPGDDLLIEQFKQQPTVLSQILAIDADDKTRAGVLAMGYRTPDCQRFFAQANAFIGNNAELVKNMPYVGHITPTIDSDGIVRRLPASICYDGEAYPALALTALARAINQSSQFQHLTPKGWLDAEQRLQHPQLPEISIPVNNQGEILLPWWLSRDALISISATDILEGHVSKQLFADRWVIIGATAFGTGDTISTPQLGMVAGVEVHAQLLSALLDNKIPYQPQGLTGIMAIWLLVISVVMILFNRLRGNITIYGAPVLAIIMIMMILAFQAYSLKLFYLWIPTSPAIIYALLTGIFLAVKGYAQNWKQSQLLYRNLTSYLPEQAAKWIANQEPVGALSAHHEKIFIVHIELRNFSNWCNQLPAEEVGAILHTFYKTVTDMVQNHGGQTEKYVGNSVMCSWRQHSNQILPAAQSLINTTEQLFGEEQRSDELPPLAVGIGIEYGEVLVGSLGPIQRREYTIIGKTVSNAVQLQAMTAELALPILVGEKAQQQWGETIPFESQGQFLLPGNQQPLEIFAPPLS